MSAAVAKEQAENTDRRNLIQLAEDYSTLTPPRDQAARQELIRRVVKKGEALPEDFKHVELLICLGREASGAAALFKTSIQRRHERDAVPPEETQQLERLNELSKQCVDRVMKILLEETPHFYPAAATELWKWRHQAKGLGQYPAPQILVDLAVEKYPKMMDKAADKLVDVLSGRRP